MSLRVGLLAVAMAAACAEEAAETEDAGGDLGTPDATARPDGAFDPGAPCVADVDCTGACLVDAADPAGGRRCFPPCDADGACPDEERCVSGAGGGRACVPVPPEPLGVGDDCSGEEACAADLVCAAEHPAGTVCAVPCDGDGACPDEERCAPDAVEPRFCAPADSNLFRCPYVKCAVPSFLCIPDDAGVSRCVALCADEGQSCPEGGLCTRRQTDGALYCRPVGAQSLGASCASGGEAACAEDLMCLAPADGHPDAVCSSRCETQDDCCLDCADDFACRRPVGRVERYCLPLPFGPGGEAGAAGASCATHGPTDCRPELDCVPGIGDAPVCATPCAADACDAGLLCHGGWCVPEPGVEPPGDRPIGAGCADGGAPVCESGVCISAGGPDDAVCSRACEDDVCPDEMACVALDAGRFCLPKSL